jgi:VanZ family protein
MRASLVNILLCILAWVGIILLAVLSLLPEQALATLGVLPFMKIVRAVLPATVEHFVAYAAVTAIAVAACGSRRGGVRIIGALCAYASILEYLRHFSPGRHPSVAKFAGSALGALCGGLVIALLWRRLSVAPRQGLSPRA